MRYLIPACDDDGPIARDGLVDEAAVAAIGLARVIRLWHVTCRVLADAERIGHRVSNQR